MQMKYKLIDLFAGAGGLSLGFAKTGQFDIKAFVEKNLNAKTTYQYNFPDADWYENVLDIDFKQLNQKYEGIDVVIGGPPCQGFSNANRQHNQAINLNNKMVKEFVRAVLEIQPRAFVMENVSMLKSDIHRFYIEKNDEDIVRKYKINTRSDSVFLLKKEFTFEGIEKIVSDLQQIKNYKWSDTLYGLLNVWYKDSISDLKLKKAIGRHLDKIKKEIRQYEFELVNHMVDKKWEIDHADNALFRFILSEDNLCEKKDKLIDLLNPAIAYQKMIRRAKEIFDNHIDATFTCLTDVGFPGDLIAKMSSCAVYDYLTGILKDGVHGYSINKGILSAEKFGVPQKRKRFVLIGVKKSYTEKINLPEPSGNERQTTVYDAISDLSQVEPYTSIKDDNGVQTGVDTNQEKRPLAFLRDKDGPVYNHIVTQTTPEAMTRFKMIKQGQNFHDLPDELKENTYTNVKRTQNTIYKRLAYDEPSGTVVNVRKSMWIHPIKDRAVSIREAARLQTFPDSFRFFGSKDAQYQQVGNAVPPLLAKAIAKQILKYIDKKDNQ